MQTHLEKTSGNHTRGIAHTVSTDSQQRKAVSPVQRMDHSESGLTPVTSPVIQRWVAPPIQRKKREQEEKEAFQLMQPVQRVVDAGVPIGARIIIDGEDAPDRGDTGIIRRPSRVKPNCMAVEFDGEPGVLYRVYFHEMSVLAEEKATKPGPGILRGGGGTTRMSMAAFWDVWQTSQRDDNIHPPAVARYEETLRAGKDADAPFLETSYLTEEEDMKLIIRTGDGRHRLTAAHNLGLPYVYIIMPTETILEMAMLAGVKETLFPDL